MPRRKTAIITIEEAKARFGEWRQNRRGKARIPADLWSAAVAVARKEGLNRTARELHVACPARLPLQDSLVQWDCRPGRRGVPLRSFGTR